MKTDEHFEDDKTTNLLVFKDNTSHHENNLSQDKGNEDVYIKVEDLEAASKQDDDKQQDTLGKSLISNLIPIWQLSATLGFRMALQILFCQKLYIF